MCGRFTMTYPDAHLLAESLGVPDGAVEGAGEYRPRYNIAPTDWHYILRLRGEDLQLLRAKWGLVNSWASDAGGAAVQQRSQAGGQPVLAWLPDDPLPSAGITQIRFNGYNLRSGSHRTTPLKNYLSIRLIYVNRI